VWLAVSALLGLAALVRLLMHEQTVFTKVVIPIFVVGLWTLLAMLWRRSGYLTRGMRWALAVLTALLVGGFAYETFRLLNRT
jgi:hypothetical protein